MSRAAPTIGVDMFKDLINQMKTEIKSDLGNLGNNLGTMGTKIDNINARLNYQDQRISDLGQRVESIEKHITTQNITYAEPQQHNTNINSTPNTTTSSTLHNITNSTSYSEAQSKNHDLTAEEIMHRSKHIVGIYPITQQDIQRNTGDTPN